MDEILHHDKFFLFAQKSIILLVFLLPFWFLPTTTSPVVLNKVFLVSFLTVFASVFYLIHAVRFAKVNLSIHWIFYFLGGSLFFWLLSALFSKPKSSVVWWGISGTESTSFFAMVIFCVLVWLISNIFYNKESFKKLIFAIVGGFMVFAVLFLVFVTGVGRFVGGIFSNTSFNTIGSWNGVGIVSGFMIMLLFPFLLEAVGRRRWILGIFSALLVAIVAIIDFTLVWIFLGLFSIVFLSYMIWRHRVVNYAFLVISFLLAISICGFFFQGTIQKIFSVNVPIEVSISHKASFDVVADSLKSNLFFGNGPGTFRYVWDFFKPQEVNNSIFWALRFDVGSSFLLSILAEIGILGWLVFVGFLGTLWYFVFLAASSQKQDSFSVSIFLGLSYSMLMWIFYPANFTLVAIGFLSIGLALALLRINSEKIKVREITLFDQSPFGFMSAILVVFLIIALTVGFYIVSSRYVGQVLFGLGVNSFNKNGDSGAAKQKILSAITFDKRNAGYFSSLSQLYLIDSRRILQGQKNAEDLLNSKFKDMLDKSLGAAQGALNVSPADFGNYIALGRIYEFLTSLGVNGAKDATLQNYDKALSRSPKNPEIFRDKAAVFMTYSIASGDQSALDLAKKELLKSIELKPDYAAGHFLLAQIFDAKGDLNEAIKRGEAAAILSPNDTGALFQLGLLYYKNGSFGDAGLVLERAVAINPYYSNARYFLGLIYDKFGRKDDAISQFETILALNQGNNELEKILSNLKNGKSALFEISPPNLPPEKRNDTPVEDGEDSSIKKR